MQVVVDYHIAVLQVETFGHDIRGHEHAELGVWWLEGAASCYPEDSELNQQAMGSPGPRGLWFSQGMHPNPRLWKYRWWVFHQGSPVEGWEFLVPEHSLCVAHAIRLIKRLKREEAFYLVYNRRYPRRDPESPLNPQHPRWSDAEWAPAWEDDPDPIWHGHR